MTGRELSRLERVVGGMFRWGVAVTAGLLAVGLALWLAGAPLAGRVLDAGLVVLMALPISRIALSFVDALRRRDRLLAGATAMVLLVLALTILYSVR